LGFRRVTGRGWWDRTRGGDIDVTAVPARHGVPENGYVLAAGGVTVYVAGDTRYFDELVDVATVFPALDAAVLPVGGLRLLGFPREMGPGDASRAAAVLGARRLIPIGYGDGGGEAHRRLVEMVDKRPTGEPVARRPPARLVHRRQDATLEVEVRARVEAGVAQRPHRLVEDHLAVPAPMPARHAVSFEKKLT